MARLGMTVSTAAAPRRLEGVEAVLNRQDGPYSLAVAEAAEQKLLGAILAYQAGEVLPEPDDDAPFDMDDPGTRLLWDALERVEKLNAQANEAPI